jgi:transcription-repair coupling factor (superfamily II helicase)
MTLEPLISQIAESAQDLIRNIKAGESRVNLALRRSARLPVVAALHAELNRPIILITDRTDRAITLFDELALLSPSSLRSFFPEPNPLFYENSPWGETTRRDRMVVLTQLASYHIPGGQLSTVPPLIITSARAIMTRTLPRREFLKAIQLAKTGQSISLDRLIHKFVELGYEPVSTVISPSQFAHRGGILDIWVPSEPQPSRIEFFGDIIDTLRNFDPSTQRSTPLSK